jgi:hypothetical protein
MVRKRKQWEASGNPTGFGASQQSILSRFEGSFLIPESSCAILLNDIERLPISALFDEDSRSRVPLL